MSVNTIQAISCTNIPEPDVTISCPATTCKYIALKWTPIQSLEIWKRNHCHLLYRRGWVGNPGQKQTANGRKNLRRLQNYRKGMELGVWKSQDGKVCVQAIRLSKSDYNLLVPVLIAPIFLASLVPVCLLLAGWDAYQGVTNKVSTCPRQEILTLGQVCHW